MKIAFITPVTPYKENMGGPSGHPYHLLVDRPKEIEVDIYSYNANKLSPETIESVERELRVKIHLLKQPAFFTWILKLHLTFIRLFLKYPIGYYIRLPKSMVEQIKTTQPDAVWVYGQEFSGILKQFKEFKRVHTVPDCYSLHWFRRLGCRFTLASAGEFFRCVVNYRKYYRMERAYDASDNVVAHLVGEEDVRFLQEINPNLNAVFLRHPHYEFPETPKEIKFTHPKIKLLIAGRYDFYMKERADEMVDLFANKDNLAILQQAYKLTFLGKGWEQHVDSLNALGYDVEHVKFAPDYIEEVCKHDIQLTPIAIGTGTKGKVLDALANGLLVVGTPYALENIAVENGVSCVEYRSNEELLAALKDIPRNVEKYEQMAEAGREAIFREHGRKRISQQLMELFK
ncbi:glycosyltransferase [Hoylesella shahii]|jgi:hypothetical protein|uniref:glycosyltransferase family protein n=1 Tax=Hoylesella shahii TaxID=228603 RepID=UPI001CB60D72|nr:glycosyltransferase [Hoylesella shahii]MBF1575801.1 glycosyltransferase [Hoylesella shahii]